MTRLFVPLSSQPFYNFRDNGKTVELREYKGAWNSKNVVSGRAVELRRGYSTDDSLYGVVGKVVVGTIQNILTHFSHTKISPLIQSKKEFIDKCTYPKYIAFEVVGLTDKKPITEIKQQNLHGF